MKSLKVDLATFKRDTEFYPEIDLLVTIKSFDLQAIRARYIESKKNAGGRRGSVERRKAGLGGVARIKLNKGRIEHEQVLAHMKEPRGIAAQTDRLALSAENEVFVLQNGTVKVIENPWFSYIHTLDFSKNNRLLVSSSGFDLILEYDLASLQQTYEWLSWEHGFFSGHDPKTGEAVRLTRKELPEYSGKTMLIDDPQGQKLATAMRAAFINSVVYDSESTDHLLATFFHEGAVYRIDMRDGSSVALLDGLKNPHGGRRHHKQVMATSTGTGEVVFRNENDETRIAFANLPNKPAELGDAEWLQNSTVVGPYIITIDSNRTSFVVFDLEHQRYDLIPYNSDWAIQDVVLVGEQAGFDPLITSLNQEEA